MKWPFWSLHSSPHSFHSTHSILNFFRLVVGHKWRFQVLWGEGTPCNHALKMVLTSEVRAWAFTQVTQGVSYGWALKKLWTNKLDPAALVYFGGKFEGGQGRWWGWSCGYHILSMLVLGLLSCNTDRRNIFRYSFGSVCQCMFTLFLRRTKIFLSLRPVFSEYPLGSQ